MCDPISLDKRKKNSNEVVSEKKEICPKTSKYIQCTDGKELKMIPLQCKRFDCPVCGARRIAMERDRYHKMLKAYWDELQVLYPDRFKKGGKYWVKMLSLTCPGKDYLLPAMSMTNVLQPTTGTLGRKWLIKTCSTTTIS